MDLSPYEKVIYVNTEKIFDEVLNNLPKFMKESVYSRRKETKDKYENNEVRTRLEWIDYAVDIWAFFGNKKIYDRVTSKVRKRVEKLQSEGYTVDILAHSLGTMIALHSGAVVNNFFCLASPMGISNTFLRKAIHWHYNKSPNKLKSKNTLVLWGTADYVSKSTDAKVISIFKKHCDKLVKFKTEAHHKIVDIFYMLRKSNKIELFTDYFSK